MARKKKNLYDHIVRRRIQITGVVFALLIYFQVKRGHVPFSIVDVEAIWGVVGLVVTLFGIYLRCFAAGILHKEKKLATTGPYSLMRHPLYGGTFSILFGICIIIGAWENIVAGFLILFIVYIPKIKSEERKISSYFEGQYEEFSKDTGMFFPKSMPRLFNSGWTWSQFIYNREYKNALLAVVLVALVQYWRIGF